MENKMLTAIIPFLNERYEVENTVRSILEHSANNVEIMLINDASDDGFDYKFIAEKYHVIYIENKERMGVAASRDLGVELCQTPYFLLLDAHMRFYNDLWVKRIIGELEADQRTLLCCQSQVLRLENGVLIERKNYRLSYGACIGLHGGHTLIEPDWVMQEPEGTSHLQTIPIVCVLGAGYACSKKYWQYLKGLEGLKYYGTDESYISIKVWLEGGSCKLLKDVAIGHIYRTNKIPYKTDMCFRLYNRLLIIELFIPEKYKKEIMARLRVFFYDVLPESLLILYENREKINKLKDYYQQIFTRDFSFFETLNNQYYKKDVMIDSTNDILRNIAVRIENESVSDMGILKGRMGIILFLFHYARFSCNESYKILAEKKLTELLKNIQMDTHYGFGTGLSGIGWGIEYLYQQGFIEGDTNEILTDFDKKVMEIDPKRIVNQNKDYGLGGIVLYLLARLYTIEKEKKDNPFDRDYLSSVYDRICKVIEQRDTTCDSTYTFIEFSDYYQDKKAIPCPEIYDSWCLLNPQNTPLPDLELGLLGAAGIGIKLMLNSDENIDTLRDFVKRKKARRLRQPIHNS
jgi:glycosyltransferase involved in cell wall biosynthesis